MNVLMPAARAIGTVFALAWYAVMDAHYYFAMRPQWRYNGWFRYCKHCGTEQTVFYEPWNLKDPRTGSWVNTVNKYPCHIQH